MKNTLISLMGAAFAFGLSMQCFAETFTVKSPDGKIEASLEDGAQLKFSLSADGKKILENCPIGMSTDKGEIGKNAKAKSVEKTSRNDVLKPVFGIRSAIKDNYNQIDVDFGSYKVSVRAYDEAAAYRFVADFGGEMVVKDEILDLVSAADTDKIIAHVVQGWRTSFERPWSRETFADLKKQPSASLPLIFEKSGMKIAVVESSWFEYPGMRIGYPKGASNPRAMFAPYPKKLVYDSPKGMGEGMYVVEGREDFIAKTSGTRAFPWRGFIVARTDADLADNDTVYKLAEPNKIGDTSWVKFGATVWDWWVDWNIEGVDFQTGFNVPTCKYYVDFAAENNIPFITLDAGWHVGRGADKKAIYDKDEPFLSETPAVDIPAIVKYADEKGVKVVIWVYSKVLFNNPVKALDLYKKWGVSGLKIDFTDRDDQLAIRHFENIARLAAERKMVIDFHGCFAPAGFQRTYPNVINFEGVFGGEMNKFFSGKGLTPSHNVDLVFTRMLSGSMDYTPGGMRNCAEGQHYKCRNFPAVQGTRAHMAAQYVLFFAPLQMLSDMPSEYLKNPELLEFLAGVPTSWDDTKVLGGKIGEYVVVARRKGDVWYVGGMCDWSGKKVSLDLSKFLDGGSYKAEIISDGINADRLATDYKIEKKSVKASDTLEIQMAHGGGFAVKLSPRWLF